MDSVNRGLVLFDRPDLCCAHADVVEWRVKAFDGRRLWGLRGQSHFCDHPTHAVLRLVEAAERPDIAGETIDPESVEFVFQVPAGRRLEERVLDVLRLRRVVRMHLGIDAADVLLRETPGQELPDEFMIADQLLDVGID